MADPVDAYLYATQQLLAHVGLPPDRYLDGCAIQDCRDDWWMAKAFNTEHADCARALAAHDPHKDAVTNRAVQMMLDLAEVHRGERYALLFVSPPAYDDGPTDYIAVVDLAKELRFRVCEP